MKAIVINEPGGPEKLVYTEVPKPAARPGWSLVKVMGFGINHSEIFTRKGLSPSVEFPRILGIECVGVLEESADPERLPAGSKIISIMGEMGRAFDGGYAEYVLLPNEQIYTVETDLEWDVLAAIPETFYTAFGSMKNLRIRESDRVLVRGATSGVGIAFLKLIRAKYPQLYVAGSTRNPAKSRKLLETGFDSVFIEKDGILQTDETFDKVLELIGPAALADTFSHTEEGGIVCSTGQLGGQWYMRDLDPIMDLPANGYLTSFYSGNVDSGKLQEMLDYIEEYGVDVTPEKVFLLPEVPEAHRYLESSGSFGKVVVVNTQDARLDYLVEEFKADSEEYRNLETPADPEGKRTLLRSLMNVRMPKEFPSDALKVQDDYLKECAAEKGVVQLSDIPVIRDGLSIWQGDITRLAADAIVNAANSRMLGCFIPMHNCIDNCIHSFAGIQLRAECGRQMNQRKIRYGRNYEQPTAVPMLTDAFNLPAKKIIHIVGPIVQTRVTPNLAKDLADCYENTLEMCAENNLKSVAFCCISTGVFRFPRREAAEIAVRTAERWLAAHPGVIDRVIFNVFNDEDKEIYEKLI